MFDIIRSLILNPGEVLIRTSKDPPTWLDRETRALRFLYLNRNCFNGIYRTNTQGVFNVPMGKKQGAYFSKANLIHCSDLLGRAKLVSGDFMNTIEHVKKRDLVYLDPPYALQSRRMFTQYGSRSFGTSDIPRFAEALDYIEKKGADFVVSYADCREARKVADTWNSMRVPVRRNVAGFAGNRKTAYEWLISNMPVSKIAGNFQ